MRAIRRINKCRKAGGYYALIEELTEIIEEAFEEALDNACVEIFEGKYDRDCLLGTIEPAAIKADALSHII